jgi:catechol 2,3-dioxygenase-like lactoylglutathione lyase family enzyme
VRVYNLTFDAHEPVRLAEFWSAVLERPVGGTGDFFAYIDRTATEPAVLFIKVPEDKVAKNRFHLDLDCDDLLSTRRQLEELGASFVHERDEHGAHWMTFQDPEGNEFCVGVHGG